MSGSHELDAERSATAEETAVLTPDERDRLRDAAYRDTLGPECEPLVARLADELDEDNAATAAYVIRCLAKRVFRAATPDPDARVLGKSPEDQ